MVAMASTMITTVIRRKSWYGLSFDHQTIKRKKRGKGRTHSGSSGDIDDFLRELDQLVETGKGNRRNFCYSFIIRSSIKQLNKLKQKSLSKITKENRDVSNFISDLLHMRLHNRKKKIRSNFLRIFFQNKGIEKVNNYSIKSLILYPPLSKTVNRQLCFTSEVKLLVERFSITNKLWRNSKLKTGRLKTFPATVRNPKCVTLITDT